MAHMKGVLAAHKKRKKVPKLAKGCRGAKSRYLEMVKQVVMKSDNYAYIGREHRKRNFRHLWITRISTACKMSGVNYPSFMNGLKRADIALNHKMLSEIIVSDEVTFQALVEKMKAAL